MKCDFNFAWIFFVISFAVAAASGESYYEQQNQVKRAKFDGVPPFTLAASAGDLSRMKTLIDNGADLDKFDWLGQTALHMASKFQQVEAAKLLLESGANCCIPNEEFEETPLHLAAKTGSLPIMRLLIDHGANVNAKINEGIIPGGSPLCYAALYSPTSFLTAKMLLENGAKASALNSQGQSAMQLYAESGNVRTVVMLVEGYGASVDLPNTARCTPLYSLSTSSFDSHTWPVIAYLLSKRANTEATCSDSRRMPIHNAAINGNKLFVEMLLKAGANVDARDRWGRTPLYMAVGLSEHIDIEMIALLLQYGADPNAQHYNIISGCRNSTAIMSTILRRMRQGLSGDDATAAYDTLIEHGAEPDPYCDDDTVAVDERKKAKSRGANKSLAKVMGRAKKTPTSPNPRELAHASILADYDVVGALLFGKNGSRGSLKAVDEITGKYAIHWAAAGEYVYAAKLMLDAGADPNAIDASGYRPIFYAASTGNVKMLDLLIERGAKVEAEDGGSTALKQAIEKANSAYAVEVLLRHGASVSNKKYDPSLLHLAAINQNIRIMQMLIENGAHVDEKSDSMNGRTALAALVESDCCYPQIPALDALIKAGANLEAKDKDGKTSLHIAIATRKRKEVIKYLLNRGADANAVDFDNCNAPLYSVIKRARTDSYRYFRHAMGSNDDEDDVLALCRYLISAEARVNAVDPCSGKTALQLAREKGLSKVAKLLQQQQQY